MVLESERRNGRSAVRPLLTHVQGGPVTTFWTQIALALESLDSICPFTLKYRMKAWFRLWDPGV